ATTPKNGLTHHGYLTRSTGPPLFEWASSDVVIDNADRLQQRVDDSGADKREVAAFQIFAHAIGQLGCGMEVGDGSWAIDDRLSIDPVPQIRCEGSKLLLNAEDSSRIGTGAVDLEPVPNDAFIAAESFEAAVIEGSDLGDVKGCK